MKTKKGNLRNITDEFEWVSAYVKSSFQVKSLPRQEAYVSVHGGHILSSVPESDALGSLARNIPVTLIAAPHVCVIKSGFTSSYIQFIREKLVPEFNSALPTDVVESWLCKYLIQLGLKGIDAFWFDNKIFLL